MKLDLPAAADIDLTPVDRPPELQPVIVYLALLRVSSRRPQATALAAIAAILTAGQCPALQLPWHRLRFQPTNAVRATLAERYAPATARYDRRGERAKRSAAAKLHVPWTSHSTG